METRPSRGITAALHSLFRLRQNMFSSMILKGERWYLQWDELAGMCVLPATGCWRELDIVLRARGMLCFTSPASDGRGLCHRASHGHSTPKSSPQGAWACCWGVPYVKQCSEFVLGA